MKEFTDWFCIKNRNSFMIDPKVNFEDSKFYFGRKEIEDRIIKQIRTGFITLGAPKMLLIGPYGSGKTQTLYHIDWLLKNGKISSLLKPCTVHLDLEMGTKSSCAILHQQMLEALGKNKVSFWINQLFTSVKDIEPKLKELFNDDNMVQAAINLRYAGGGGEAQLLAWRWFCGHKMTNADLGKLNITRSLSESGGAVDLVNALVGIGRLAEISGEKIIFFIDEAEKVNDVTNADAISSIRSYIRKLSEPTSSSIGFILSVTAFTRQEIGEIFARPDIMTRIGEHNYIEIPVLPSIEDVRTFLKEMLNHFVDQEKAAEIIKKEKLDTDADIFPFKHDSLEQLCEYASQDITKTLPRLIIRAVNECAVLAWDKESRTIDQDSIEEIGSMIFVGA